jgi:hypothetical protein
MTPEGTPERDLFGVVPQQRAPDTKAMVGPEMPVLEPLPGAQAEIPFAGQGELFTGREPVQPPRTPAVEPVAKPAAPIDVPSTIKTVVEGAKQDPTASKLLRANNPATAAVVEARVQELMPQANNDPIVAIEQLYTQNKTGKYPAGTKPLSEAQQELLEALYHNLTGVDIEQAIRNREFLGAAQEDFFAQPQPSEPGATPPNVGVPGEPGAGTPPEGTGGGVGVGVVPGQPPATRPAGGAGAQPSALSPEQAWERHREAGVHPAYGELDPEERAAWDKAVKAGRGNSVNFAGVVNTFNQRTAATAPRTAAQVKEALDQFGKEMSEDIENDLSGKSFLEALKFLMTNGPKANREIAKAIYARAKEMMANGYKFKFAVARDAAGVRRIGGYSPGVLGRVQPDYFKKVMDISVAGKNSGQPFGAQYRTMTHESLHAVTAAMVDYGTRNPNTKIGRLVKELKQLSDYVRKHLEAKEARGEKLTASEERVLNGTNALGNSMGAGRRYNQEHEMIAHGMTSSFMQEVLETIPYTAKKQTAFTRFVEIVREMLGLTPKSDTALTRVISLTEQLMEAPIGAIVSQAGKAKGRGAPTAPITSTVSQAFKRWFGKSKVVDADGKPLMVYHGTKMHDDYAAEEGQAFEQFAGFPNWFGAEPYTASGYAGATGTVYPVYLSIQNPLSLPFDANDDAQIAIEVAKRLGVDTSQFNPDDKAFVVVNSAPFVEAAQRAGFDGIEINEGGYKTFAAFEPNQIKSVFNQAPTEAPGILQSSIPVPPGPTNIPAPGQKYTLPKLTKLQAAPTTPNQVKAVAKKVQNAYNDSNFWTRFRIGWVDPTSGLAKTLQKLPAFQNGQLRADMLVRSFSQVINLIKNGLQSGIPVINNDGTVIIRRDASNLARSQKVADGLDSNPIVKGSGMSGRDYVAEIARIKRGEEIMQIDADRRAKAAQMMQEARNKMQQAKLLRAAGAPLTQILKLVNQAKALRQKYRADLTVNREKQVTQAHIAWADQQLAAVPGVQEVFNVWRDINVGLLNLWQEAGLLTQAQADYYRSMKNYVPLFAAREDLAPADQETYTGKAGGTKSVRELDHLSGSDLQRNIWENQDKLYASMTAAAYQNQTRKIAVQQLKSLGAAHIARNADDPDINLRYRDPSNPDADANGIVHAVVDNPNDVAAFQAMHYELGPLMKGLAGTTQLLRATALVNPMYWIKQLIRDPLHASLVTNSGVVTPFHSASEFTKILAGQSEEAKILASRGVIGQVDSTIDLHDFLKQAGTEKLNPSMLDKALHKVMQVHEASDAATRVAIFKKAKQEGLKKGMSEAEAIDYGVFVARESINFAVRGNSKTLNALRHMIPFMSASITSLDTLFRAATGYGLNPEEKAQIQRVFYSRAAVMAILSTVYAMSLQDDDDYKRLPDNVKDNNWLMPNPWGTDGKSFIKVPVPFEIGFFFKTIPEAAVRYMSGTSTGKEMLASILGGVKHNLPGEGVLIPQAAKPALEAITGYSFFTQRPIEGMSDQGKPVAERGPNASEFAKTLSKLGLDKIGLSPAKIDYLIQGYTAELGTFITGIASTLIAQANGKVPPNKNLEEKPFFKSFMTNPNTSEAASDFYEIAHTAQETVNAYNDKRKRGLKEEAQYIASDEEKRKLIAVAPMLRNVQNNMALIRSQINVLKEKSDLDPEERRLRINKLMERYDQQAQKGYVILEKAGIER